MKEGDGGHMTYKESILGQVMVGDDKGRFSAFFL